MAMLTFSFPLTAAEGRNDRNLFLKVARAQLKLLRSPVPRATVLQRGIDVCDQTRRTVMPSLMRFLTVIAAMAALGFGAVFALATLVTPRTREIVVNIPTSKLRPAAAAQDGADRSAGARAAATDVVETR
ncbi:hypothetical protein [Methylopila sp. Yamaguchi]|uniref:hypothetical protein n=1 Tax=Methylopila sp. Yamaguchi TaxID=1437817 RepID=UPI001FCED2B5|nr:hypothetical protein [Methylopila sp. Yamaguchi]